MYLENFRISKTWTDSPPEFSWNIASERENTSQQRFALELRREGARHLLSGTEEIRICPQVPYGPYESWHATLTVWDNHGDTDTAGLDFHTGRYGAAWDVPFITTSLPRDNEDSPVCIFEKRFSLEELPALANIDATALGCYELTLNGKKVSTRYFAPGYTQYTHRVLYQSYPVTQLLCLGENVLRAEVAPGWYGGHLGLTSRQNLYGDKIGLSLDLMMQQGTKRRHLVTDESWQYTLDGPRTKAGFFYGEDYDARRQKPQSWRFEQALVLKEWLPRVEEDPGAPVLAHDEVLPVSLREMPDGSLLYDFGRNLAGIVGFRGLEAESGRLVTIRHAELLMDGELYTQNLRTARAELRYICEDGVNDYEPRFSYMGFRYVQVSGLETCRDGIYARELYSGLTELSDFSCSDASINQLQVNILTSQKANFIDIPTDCPQRDERCGWTGDIALFAPTAVYNMDIRPFMDKWLRDVQLAQNAKGVVPFTVPTGNLKPKDGFWGTVMHHCCEIWGDVIVLVPWAVYRATGDERVLRENYGAMKAWVEYELNQAGKCSVGHKRFIWSWGLHLGDWLAMDGGGKKEARKRNPCVATAYMAHSADLLGKIAAILGKQEEAEHYRGLFDVISAAFRREFLDKNNHLKVPFQTGYVLAICFGLLTPAQEKTAVRELQRLVREKGNHLTTGFAGAPHLLFALCDHGAADTAYDLLLQDTCPSWLYPVKCGATSIWERWDGLLPDGTVRLDDENSTCMASFNHYAYGAVGRWLYSRMAGLEETAPGYKRFRVAPIPGGNVTWAKFAYRCPFGQIRVSWEKNEKNFRLAVTVPCGTEAEILLPSGDRFIRGSGSYCFEE